MKRQSFLQSPGGQKIISALPTTFASGTVPKVRRVERVGLVVPHHEDALSGTSCVKDSGTKRFVLLCRYLPLTTM